MSTLTSDEQRNADADRWRRVAAHIKSSSDSLKCAMLHAGTSSLMHDHLNDACVRLAAEHAQAVNMAIITEAGGP